MSVFDPGPYQRSPNGPLTVETVQRLVHIKERTGMSYAALGAKLGFSGTFLYNLMLKNANVGTQHVERVARAIVRLEEGDSDEAAPGEEAHTVDMLDHPFHLRADLQIVVSLPVDLTEREAERLGKFVQSLPVG